MAASSSTVSPEEDLPFVDDFYFSALHDHDELFPISDEKYAEELQLQEALISSALCNPPGSSSDGHTANLIVTERGESSKTHESFCDICMDSKPFADMFANTNCSHLFCNDCISRYVASKIKENTTAIACPTPNCKSLISPEFCRSIVPKDVFDRWECVLSESLILDSQKIYCPFKDCSAVLEDDGEEIVTVSECPYCRRLFCAQCKVVWHCGMVCSEYQKLNKNERQAEDLMLMELAKNKKWKRCRKCKFYVEKKEGCLHITCRCGSHFCYGCGANWTANHECRAS